MSILSKIAPVLVPVAALVGIAVKGVTSGPESQRTPVQATAVSTTVTIVPAAEQVHLLYARPFVLAEGYAHAWRAEQPIVSSGWLLVIEAPRELLAPKQTTERVLYVGDQTAERVNVGEQSGHLVAIVPSPLGVDGLPKLDLHQARIWFGEPALPEQVDAARIATELDAARAAGHAPLASAEVTAALAAGGTRLEGQDHRSLDNEAGGLMTVYAPEEVDRIQALTLPVLPH